MKIKSTMAIGVVVFCFMMMKSDAAWCTTRPQLRQSGPAVDNGDGTLTIFNLVWLKNANCFGNMTWDEANGLAKSLASGKCGLTDKSHAGDWRLPTFTEMTSVVRYRDQFSNPQGLYWTAIPFYYRHALAVDFTYGVTRNDAKNFFSNKFFFLCVRDGQ